jgi:hypothetical protein
MDGGKRIEAMPGKGNYYNMPRFARASLRACNEAALSILTCSRNVLSKIVRELREEVKNKQTLHV